MMAHIHNPRRIADYSDTGRNVFRDDRAHADDRACANRYGVARPAVPDGGTGPNENAVSDAHIPAAAHARRECDVIADYAIMRNETVNIAVKVLPDLRGGRDHRVVAKDSPLTDLDFVANDRGRGNQATKLIGAAVGDFAPNSRIAHADDNLIIGAQIGKRDNPDAAEGRNWRVGEKDDLPAIVASCGDKLATETASTIDDEPRHGGIVLSFPPFVNPRLIQMRAGASRMMRAEGGADTLPPALTKTRGYAQWLTKA